jgi:putative membrane protein
MKINHKKIFVNTLIITAIALNFLACTDSRRTDDKIAKAEESKFKSENKLDKKDVEFLIKAAEINLKEIDLGGLAQQKSKSADVKEFSAMMEEQHTDAMNQLQDLANKKSVVIPISISQTGKDFYDKLCSKKGNIFDKEYCDIVVNSHKDAIVMFDKASTEIIDADIKSWAISMLPILKTHLDHAITCQEKCNILTSKN